MRPIMIFILSVLFIVMALLLSLSDISFGTFPDGLKDVTPWESKTNCFELELPERVLDGSDGSCVAAALLMQFAMDVWKVDCLLITNDGWIPTNENPVSYEKAIELSKGY